MFGGQKIGSMAVVSSCRKTNSIRRNSKDARQKVRKFSLAVQIFSNSKRRRFSCKALESQSSGTKPILLQRNLKGLRRKQMINHFLGFSGEEARVHTRSRKLFAVQPAVLSLGEAETMLSKLSFGMLMISTGFYWFKTAFTDLKELDLDVDADKSVENSSDVDDLSTSMSPELFSLLGANISLIATLSYRWYDSGHFPLSNLYESLLFLGWGITSVQFWLQTKVSKSASAAGAVTVPGALLMVAFAALLLPPELQRSSSLVPALKSNWLTMHVTVIMMSYASLLVGSLLSAGYLLLDQPNESILGKLRDSLPSFRKEFSSGSESTIKTLQSSGAMATTSGSFVEDNSLQVDALQVQKELDNDDYGIIFSALDTVDNLAYRSVGLGFAFLTVGIISGAVWANEAWGSYWSWDPKETWALITWLVYAMYLHTRLSLDWNKNDVAKLGSAGFAVIMICYIGVNLWGVGLHSYGFFSN